MLGKKLTAAVEAKILTNVMSNYVEANSFGKKTISKGGSRVKELATPLLIGC